MKKLLILLLPFIIAAGGKDGIDIPTSATIDGIANCISSDGITIVSGGDGSCDLFEDDFEGADGTDITAYGWTADGTDPGNLIEIDTAQSQAGSSSVLISGGTADRKAYDGFTEQTSGFVTFSFYLRVPALANTGYIALADSSTETVNISVSSTGYLSSYYDGSWRTFAGCAISADTWYLVEVEVDLDNDDVDYWMDDVSCATNIATNTAATNPDNARLINSNSRTGDIWFDELCVYDGARQ